MNTLPARDTLTDRALTLVFTTMSTQELGNSRCVCKKWNALIHPIIRNHINYILPDDVLAVIFTNMNTKELGKASLICKKWKALIQPILQDRLSMKKIDSHLGHKAVISPPFLSPALIRYTLNSIAKLLHDKPQDVSSILKATHSYIHGMQLSNLKEMLTYLKPIFENPNVDIRCKALDNLQCIMEQAAKVYNLDQKYSFDVFFDDCCHHLIQFVENKKVQEESATEATNDTKKALQGIAWLGAREQISEALQSQCITTLIGYASTSNEAIDGILHIGASGNLSSKLQQQLVDQLVKMTKQCSKAVHAIGHIARSAKLPIDSRKKACADLISLAEATEKATRHAAVLEITSIIKDLETSLKQKCYEVLLRVSRLENDETLLKALEGCFGELQYDFDSKLFDKSCILLADFAKDKTKARSIRKKAILTLEKLLTKEKTPLQFPEYYASVFIPFVQDKDLLITAAGSLGELGKLENLSIDVRKECCLALIPCLQDSDKLARRTSVWALGYLVSPDLFPKDIAELCYNALLQLAEDKKVSFELPSALNKIKNVESFSTETLEKSYDFYISLSDNKDIESQLKVISHSKMLVLRQQVSPAVHEKCCTALIIAAQNADPLVQDLALSALSAIISLEWISNIRKKQLCNALIELTHITDNRCVRVIKGLKNVICHPNIPLKLRQKCVQALFKTAFEDKKIKVISEIALSSPVPFSILENCIKYLTRAAQHDTHANSVILAAQGLLKIGMEKSDIEDHLLEPMRESCFAPIFALSSRPEPSLRQNAALCLGLIGKSKGSSPALKKQCCEILLKLAKSNESSVKSQVVKSLLEIITQSHVALDVKSLCFAEVIALSKDSMAHVLRAVAKELDLIGRFSSCVPFPMLKKSYEILLELSQSYDDMVQGNSARSLCSLAAETSIPPSLHKSFRETIVKLSYPAKYILHEHLIDLAASKYCTKELGELYCEILFRRHGDMPSTVAESLGMIGSAENTHSEIRRRCYDYLIQLSVNEKIGHLGQTTAIQALGMMEGSPHLDIMLQKRCREAVIQFSLKHNSMTYRLKPVDCFKHECFLG